MPIVEEGNIMVDEGDEIIIEIKGFGYKDGDPFGYFNNTVVFVRNANKNIKLGDTVKIRLWILRERFWAGQYLKTLDENDGLNEVKQHLNEDEIKAKNNDKTTNDN